MPSLTLAAFSAAAGVLILLAFKLTSNQRALKAARRQLRAHLLAIRLFADDPVLILRSQGRLLIWTACYMALLIPAFLVIAIPLFFAWDYLDALWGRAPLAAGDTMIVTARLRDNAARPQLIVPDWLAVDSPPVHVAAEREVSWRVRVRQQGSGDVKVTGAIESVKVGYPRSESWVLWFLVISSATALALRRKLRVTF